MGVFDFLKKKPEASETIIDFPVVLGANAKGTLIPLEEVQDKVFSQGILGMGCGINPTEGKVYAPLDGKVVQMTETLHAIGLEGIGGIEVLIHVGIDTVNMKGEGFHSCVKEGDFVKKGQLLMTMDLDKIKQADHLATVITIVTNSDEFSEVKVGTVGEIEPGTDMLCVNK